LFQKITLEKCACSTGCDKGETICVFACMYGNKNVARAAAFTLKQTFACMYTLYVQSGTTILITKAKE